MAENKFEKLPVSDTLFKIEVRKILAKFSIQELKDYIKDVEEALAKISLDYTKNMAKGNEGWSTDELMKSYKVKEQIISLANSVLEVEKSEKKFVVHSTSLLSNSASLPSNEASTHGLVK